jgi:hypothetical protein
VVLLFPYILDQRKIGWWGEFGYTQDDLLKAELKNIHELKMESLDDNIEVTSEVE